MVRRPLWRGAEGFTLIESVVALSIAALVFLALAASVISGVKAVAVSRENQQSGDAINQQIESLRAQPIGNVSMRATDLSGDTHTSGNYYDPTADNGTGAAKEPLVLDPAGSVNPHVSTVVQNSVTFTLRTYVTQPTDADGASYKRVTVVASWITFGTTHTRSEGTLLTQLVRGLPLPNYQYTAVGGTAQCKGVGTTVALGMRVVNNGARDTWTLTSSGSTLTWAYYKDTSSSGTPDGVYSPTVDTTVLPVESSTGLPSTGQLEPTTSSSFWAVATLPTGVVSTTYTMTFTARSLAQNTYSQNLTETIVEQSAACSGTPTPSPTPTASPTPTPTASYPPQPTVCSSSAQPNPATVPGTTTLKQYSFYAASTTANSLASSPLTFGASVPTATTLYDYSTDLHTAGTTAGGRLNVGSTSPASLMEWQYTPTGTSTFASGTTLRLWARVTNGTAAVSASFGKYNGGGNQWSSSMSGTTTGITSTTCYQAVDVTLSGSSINTNNLLGLRVTVTGAPVDLAYGVAIPNMTMLTRITGNG